MVVVQGVPVQPQSAQPPLLYQTVDQYGNIAYTTVNPHQPAGPPPVNPNYSNTNSYNSNTQSIIVTNAYYAADGSEGQQGQQMQPVVSNVGPTVALLGNKDLGLIRSLRLYFAGYVLLMLAMGVMGSLLAHYGGTIGVGVALPSFICMLLAFVPLSVGEGFSNFVCGIVTQMVFAVISISCASAAFTQNFHLTACALETSDHVYQYYGQLKDYTDAADCAHGYIYAHNSCACVNTNHACLHFMTGYTNCHALYTTIPALSLVVFILAMGQLCFLIGMLLYLVIYVDRHKV